MTPRQLAALGKRLKAIGPFRVFSLANGNITIEPQWSAYGPKECRDAGLSPEHWCPRCDCYHIGGILTRMDAAGDIERLLNDLAGYPVEPLAGKRGT